MFTADISGGKLGIHGAAPTFWVGNPRLGVIPDEDYDWKLVNTDFWFNLERSIKRSNMYVFTDVLNI